MNALAEQHGFVVLYPAQSMRANASRCWNWFSAADQQRGSGEPAWIAEVTRKVMAAFAIDPSRVYVAGLSAGGAMAAILGITYPDVFAAVGVHSGLAVGSAHDVASAFAAMRSGSAGAAIAAGSLPTIVFHGDSDSTVHPDNATFVTDQARGRRSEHVETTSAATRAGVAYERTVETDADGRALLERWRIRGAGPAWSGGSADGSFVAPDGPDASEAMWRFFREHRRLDAGTGSGLRDATAAGPAHTR
jgi:poly(hydroxyalkanoate) depolymerase family esterase